MVKTKKGFPRDYLERIGRELVKTIKERTAKGIDKNGVPFAPYSKDYIESKPFAIARKSPSNVNLKLSGEMLTDLEVIEVDSRSGTIVLGIVGAESEAKAHGHITGANETGRLPVRDFLGVSKAEIAAALSKLPDAERYMKAQKEFKKRIEIEEKKPQDRGYNPPGIEIEDVFGVIDEIADETVVF